MLAAVHAEFTYARSRKYLRRQRAFLVSRQLVGPRSAGQVLLFLGVAVPLAARGSRPAIDLGAALLIAGAIQLYRTIRLRSRLLDVPDEMIAEYRWLITDDRLEFETPDTLVRLSWSHLRLARIFPDSYLLSGQDGVLAGIPREPLSPEVDAEVRAILDRLPFAAAPLPDEPLAGDATRIEFASSQPVRPFGQRLVAMRRQAIRPAAIESGVIGIVLVAVGWIVGQALDDALIAVLGMLLGLFGLLGGLKAWMRVGRTPQVPGGVLRRFTITDQAMRAEGGGRSIRWSWPAVTRLEEWPETYVLHRADRTSFPIPRDTLTPEQERELRALFQERIVSRPGEREREGAEG